MFVNYGADEALPCVRQIYGGEKQKAHKNGRLTRSERVSLLPYPLWLATYLRLMMLRRRGCTGVLICSSLLCLDSMTALNVW
jgi:hypothetical protein